MKWNSLLALFFVILSVFLMGCSATKQPAIAGGKSITALEDSLAGGHLGICIYDPAANNYLVQHNDRKYFTPASNMKLFTCYAAMKYLGDSLVGLRYQNFSDTAVNIFPTGDPTFLHPDFVTQPALEFIKKGKRSTYIGGGKKIERYGKGWSWDDYQDSYMAERNPMPIAGNTVKIKLKNYNYNRYYNAHFSLSLNWEVIPSYFRKFLDSFYALPIQTIASRRMKDSLLEKEELLNFAVSREQENNKLYLSLSDSRFKSIEIPFSTEIMQTTAAILREDYGIKNIRMGSLSDNSLYGLIPDHLLVHKIYSQPTDSLLKPMMHRSDNFFAEQTLLMVSNEQLGYMSDDKIIDTLLKTDFAAIPDQPVWVDGSGLSRYNLVTPRDFVWLLNKMKNEFPFARIKNILPTGGEGTLLHYYNNDSGFIYAKTGTLGGQVAISGYLITNAGKTLVFSVLVSNHNGSASAIRREVESYLSAIRKKY